MCDGCQGEVHLQKSCSGLRCKPSDDTPFYCCGCTARREKQARAAAAAEQAAAQAAEEEGEKMEDGGGGGGKEGAREGVGEKVAVVAAVAKKVTPRMEFCEETEDEQRRKKRESALKVSDYLCACRAPPCKQTGGRLERTLSLFVFVGRRTCGVFWLW